MTQSTPSNGKKHVTKKPKTAIKSKSAAVTKAKLGNGRDQASKNPKRPVKTKTEQVDMFMAELEHPLKAEVQAVRKIIKGVNKEIREEIKWAAPTFSYKGYIVTFNLRAKQHVHLVFHNAAILNDNSGLLLGDYVDRRMMYLKDMKDVKAKKAALEKIIQEWIKLMDKQGTS